MERCSRIWISSKPPKNNCTGWFQYEIWCFQVILRGAHWSASNEPAPTPLPCWEKPRNLFKLLLNILVPWLVRQQGS
jgi:hypothetical protein